MSLSVAIGFVFSYYIRLLPPLSPRLRGEVAKREGGSLAAGMTVCDTAAHHIGIIARYANLSDADEAHFRAGC